ncbi:MAG: hypothetical protein IJR46_05035, partial [Neisseriaceae bacterium]|nr:hypothetical protein [Neisseriaceae bacterium]
MFQTIGQVVRPIVVPSIDERVNKMAEDAARCGVPFDREAMKAKMLEADAFIAQQDDFKKKANDEFKNKIKKMQERTPERFLA